MEEIVGVFEMGKNEKGVTLVELLAALALLSIIMLLASSVHLFGQNQMTLQTKQIENQSDDRIAIKLIIKEIRKAQTVEVKSVNTLTINGTDIYTLKDNTLRKGNDTFVSNINKFIVTKNGNQIKLTIGNLPETTIYLRE